MYTLSALAEKIKAHEVLLRQDEPIQHILTDSRSLVEPQGTLFFALRSENDNGYNYIAKLYDHGVRSFVVRVDAPSLAEELPEANFLFVRDTLVALQSLAAVWRQEFTIPIVGITGSNGKTITKEFLYQLLGPNMRIVRSPRSYNSQLGVPLSVLNMQPEDELGIFEAGISQPTEMIRLERIIRPTVGVMTNLGMAHQEHFNSLEEKVDEKLLLFAQCQQIVCSRDDEEIRSGLRRARLLDRVRGWSFHDPTAELFVRRLEVAESHTRLSFVLEEAPYEVQLPFIDRASIENVLHCLLVISIIKPELIQTCCERIAALESVEMRLELKEGNRGNIIVNDAYNNDLNSLSIALDFLKQRASSAHLTPVVVLSDIMQSALKPKALYRTVADLLQRMGCQKLFAVGPNMQHYSECFHIEEQYFFASTTELLSFGLLTQMENSCILVKGARAFHFEQITERLAHKQHETVLEVNLEALAENLHSYRSLLPETTGIIAMVKANAYGLGAYEVAKTMEERHVRYVAVAVADEGKELRLKGILTPIMVMNPEVSALDTLIEYHLEPVIYNREMLHKLYHKVNSQGFSSFPIHIEIDTGMHRLGFPPDDMDSLATEIKASNILDPRSLFTHLAAADDPAHDDFTLGQFARFEQAAEAFAAAIGFMPLRHVLNTAGIERFSQYAYDMVRLGIGLYGVSPTGRNLGSVARLTTTLLQTSQLRPGESVGYGRCGRLQKGGTIGIIPIGYADGYNRRFGGGHGQVEIAGKLYRTIGNICMDTCMIDLAGELFPSGQQVTLFGSSLLPLGSIAKAIDTIPYEIIAGLSPRIRRTYYK